MRKKTLKIISGTAAFLIAIAFVMKFGGPAILRLYVETGIGSCQKIPILCMVPEEKFIVPAAIDKDYTGELIPQDFPKMTIRIPRGFKVIQEEIKRDYYKRKSRPYSDAAIYVIHEEPDFFIELYPELRKRGINDNYEFIKRTMYARIKNTANLTDLFFIIMKGIFTPDLGDQKGVKMTQFRMKDRKGFINYNLGDKENYFDCSIITDTGDFFKVYIKDAGSRLNLNWVLAIISTADKI